MSSIAEREEQLNCLEKEIDENYDVLENIVWSLLSPPVASISSDIVAMGQNAKLKALEASMLSADWDLRSITSTERAPVHSERFGSLHDQMAKNTSEIVKLRGQMNSKELETELQQLYGKAQDARSKKYQRQHELYTLKQDMQTRKLEEMSTIGSLKDSLDNVRSAVSRQEQELQKLNNLGDLTDDAAVQQDVFE